MAEGAGGEKTEKPTPKRKKQARKDGQIPRTQELGGWFSLLLVAMAIGPLMRREINSLIDLMTVNLRSLRNPTPEVALALLGEAFRHVFVTLFILGGGILIVGLLASVAQGGFVLSPKLAKPDAKKLNPLKGAKRIFGPQSLWEGAKMLLKSAVVAFLAYRAIQSIVPLVGGLVPIPVVVDLVTSQVTKLMLTVGIAGLIMAGADYAMARRRIGKQIRMSHAEIKQEHKQSEGDPMLKGAIRARQLEAARNRMISDVSTADVVMVNPTHIAVALTYDPEKGAPRVVARGAGAIAAKIREKADEARVPTVQDVPLARALYRSTEVGQEIPRELWAAVAQVLAFVMNRRNMGAYGGSHNSPRADDPLPAVLPAGRRRRPAPAVIEPGAASPGEPTPPTM